MNKIILLVAIFSLGFSCSQKGYKINVAIEGVPNGRKVILKKQENRKIINIDSTTAENGSFSFKGEITEPVIYGIFIDSLKQAIYPFVGINDKISITAYKDSLQLSKIEGSVLQDQLTKLRDERMELNSGMSKLIPEYQAAQKANDTAKIKEINSMAAVVQDKVASNDWNFIKNNPNSYVSPMILSQMLRNPKYKDSIKSAFDGFSDEVKNSEIAKQLREYFEKQNAAPKMPPPPAPTSKTPESK